MKITAQEEYGLRCALQLARSPEKESLTITDIAEREGLSTAYVAKLLNLLRQGGVVKSVRGRSGGYSLERRGDQISVAEILGALGAQPWESRHCERFTGGLETCVHASGCAIRSLWGILDTVVEQLLRNVTLADLLSTESQPGSSFRLTKENVLTSAALAVGKNNE
jgi:Rrf2 family protein